MIESGTLTKVECVGLEIVKGILIQFQASRDGIRRFSDLAKEHDEAVGWWDAFAKAIGLIEEIQLPGGVPPDLVQYLKHLRENK